MAVFGFLLDRLPVSRRLWAAVYIVASVALFAWGLSSFPSLEKAIAKNGSISAYAFCSRQPGDVRVRADVPRRRGRGVVVAAVPQAERDLTYAPLQDSSGSGEYQLAGN